MDEFYHLCDIYLIERDFELNPTGMHYTKLLGLYTFAIHLKFGNLFQIQSSQHLCSLSTKMCPFVQYFIG